jgi:ABC-2 type transport system ATP-binding protein
MPVSAAIAVDGLRKAYDGKLVLDGLSLSVAAGETVAVLGPNGAGKTTLVEILEGFRPRDGGTAVVLGDDPARPSAAFRRQVGVVLQETAHDPWLTVAETIDQVRGWHAAPMGTDELLALVGLTEAAGKRTQKLSGGQQRRLDVALGLVGRPTLLFLDEPTTGFDPAARREAWATIGGLRALGTTVVLTTHYLDEAATLADRLFVLSAGRIVAAGPPASIGGRDRVNLVSFACAAGGPPGGEVVAGRWCAVVDDVTATVHALSEWAVAAGCALDDLTIGRPSLEDVYLELIA